MLVKQSFPPTIRTNVTYDISLFPPYVSVLSFKRQNAKIIIGRSRKPLRYKIFFFKILIVGTS